MGSSPLEWLATHVNLIGWPTVIYVVFRTTRFITKIENRFLTSERILRVVATNHLPHMERALTKISEDISGLREDIKEVLKERQHE